MGKQTWKLLDLLGEASGFFASRGMGDPRLQAELLLAAALGVARLDLYLQFDRQLTPGEVEVFRGFVRERLRGLPIQYVTGEAAFRLLDLRVSPDVLIPRPETEVLVDVALELLAGTDAPRVLDPGCGSGAIAIAIAREHATARVTATDISPAAVRLARDNAGRHNLESRVSFICTDLIGAMGAPAEFDAVVGNPPYVPTADMGELEEQVRDYEPHLALDGGPDGLDFYRRLTTECPAVLAAGGWLVVEVGDGQAEDVAEMLRGSGSFDQVETRPDLSGTARIVVGSARLG